MTRLGIAFVLMAGLCRAEKQAVTAKDVPSAGLPFSQAILADGTLYLSGMVGKDRKTGKIPADFETELKNCLDTLGLTLKAAGMNFDNVVSVQIYLTDVSLFPRMNAIYKTYFKDPMPARATVGVNALVDPSAHAEITMIARK